jgi:hypothetical protein
VELDLAEARRFVRELVGAVYFAKPADSVRVPIDVAANGYHLEITRADEVVRTSS